MLVFLFVMFEILFNRCSSTYLFFNVYLFSGVWKRPQIIINYYFCLEFYPIYISLKRRIFQFLIIVVWLLEFLFGTVCKTPLNGRCVFIFNNRVFIISLLVKNVSILNYFHEYISCLINLSIKVLVLEPKLEFSKAGLIISLNFWKV